MPAFITGLLQRAVALAVVVCGLLVFMSSLIFAAPHFRQEVRATAHLALPLVLGHISAGLIAFVDNVIAGQHGTVTLSAVSIGTALLWLPMLVPIGTLIALTASVSQLHGAGNNQAIGPLFRQALWLSAALGLLMFGFLSAVPQLLPAFGTVAESVPGATAFLHAVRWGALVFPLFFCMRYLSEGMHWTLPAMLFGFGGLLVLAPLGYALCNGRWGLPELGAQGLGMASAFMMWVQALGFVIYLAVSKRFAEINPFACFELPRWSVMADLLRTGLPIGITVLMEGGLFVVTALLISRLGTLESAAHQIALNVSNLFFMLPLGIAEATTVRVGHAVGSRNALGVRRSTWAGYSLVLCTQTLLAGALLFWHGWVVTLYTSDMAVAALASTLLLCAAAYQFPDGIQVLSAGILRGMKDTRVPMFIAIFSYWAVGMPLGAGLGLGLNWGPVGMWMGLIVGLITAALLLGWRVWASCQNLRF